MPSKGSCCANPTQLDLRRRRSAAAAPCCGKINFAEEGVQLPFRPVANFIGDGVSGVDNVLLNRTDIYISGVFRSITVDADYTAVPPFYVIFVSGVLPAAVPGPARTISLPATPVLDSEYTVKDVTGTAALATPIVVDGNGALIDGVATRQIATAYGSLHMKFDGTEWRVL